ncbi:hypothetical protein [Sphingobacterium multivorum]|uniref:hypothetical protein n=1 Tax=Sphingobacterium multivorum TaxID=28454 RepID=UPI00301A7F88
MNHSIDNYIKDKLQKLGWEDKNLVEKTGLSKGQISKLKNGHVDKNWFFFFNEQKKDKDDLEDREDCVSN